MTVHQYQPWQEEAAVYRVEVAGRIPKEWMLPASIIDSISAESHQVVLDIPRTCGLLTTEELDITENYDAVAMAQLLAEGKFTSVVVTTAFCKRAAIAQQLVRRSLSDITDSYYNDVQFLKDLANEVNEQTHCLTETFFNIALERARYCDEYLAKEKKTLGPFHGLPISLKESFSIQGVRSTIGFVSYITHAVKESNSALVDILLGQGAVLYVKTNIPQTMMTADSQNNIFGRTLNPHRLCLTAGGSSGGEGALLAMKGSIIGVGTDIAGSIRIPAYVAGTIGYRPTSRRIPYYGQTSAGRPGSWGILPVAGPLTRSVRDVEFFLSTVLGAQNDIWALDEATFFAPWRSVPQETDKKLRIGVFTEEAKFPLHPSVLRTFRDAVAKLEAAGHTVVDMEKLLPAMFLEKVSMTSWELFNMDPTKFALANLINAGEEIIKSISMSSPAYLKHFNPSLDDVFRLNVETRTLTNQFKNAWVNAGVDALVMPVFQATAVGHDQYGIPHYTVMANLLDCPSVSVPYGEANAELDAPFRREVSYIPAYVPKEVEGAPSGFQVLGRPGRDEELVVTLKIVEEAIRA